MSVVFQTIDTENWMGKLPSTLHNLPIYSLAIPGTHDSFSYSIEPSSKFAPDEPWLSSFPLKYFPCIVKPLAYRWCKCGTNVCAKQLSDGIRYFDFRVAARTYLKSGLHHPEGVKSVRYEIVHGMYGEDVETVLLEIVEFLKFHPKEIVFLDFQWMFDMAPADHRKLIKMFHDIFQDMLCPVVGSLTFVTLDWLWKKQQQVFIFYRDIDADPVPYIWPRSKIPNPWPNTVCPDILFRILTRNWNKKRDDCFYVTQAILTPRIWTILSNITDNMSCLAREVNPRLLGWLQNKHAGSSGINIVICDFYDILDVSIPKHVIYLNYKQKKTPAATTSPTFKSCK